MKRRDFIISALGLTFVVPGDAKALDQKRDILQEFPPEFWDNLASVCHHYEKLSQNGKNKLLLRLDEVTGQSLAGENETTKSDVLDWCSRFKSALINHYGKSGNVC